ncbi:MAG: hypothetical protein E7521_09370 [Ruminococcaceae bacterium]|nr:hypothetical protein [Oscillospiraceae bacterium]MBE6811234.1 hypothetical protein [Oscillospiraceae bacterium]
MKKEYFKLYFRFIFVMILIFVLMISSWISLFISISNGDKANTIYDAIRSIGFAVVAPPFLLTMKDLLVRIRSEQKENYRLRRAKKYKITKITHTKKISYPEALANVSSLTLKNIDFTSAKKMQPIKPFALSEGKKAT